MNSCIYHLLTNCFYRADAKASGGHGGTSAKESAGFRLLGDLPSLGPKSTKEEVRIALNLELPGEASMLKVKQQSSVSQVQLIIFHSLHVNPICLTLLAFYVVL